MVSISISASIACTNLPDGSLARRKNGTLGGCAPSVGRVQQAAGHPLDALDRLDRNAHGHLRQAQQHDGSLATPAEPGEPGKTDQRVDRAAVVDDAGNRGRHEGHRCDRLLRDDLADIGHVEGEPLAGAAEEEQAHLLARPLHPADRPRLNPGS